MKTRLHLDIVAVDAEALAQARAAFERAVDEINALPIKAKLVAGAPGAVAGHAPGALTARQEEILALIVEGLPNKLIAHRLALSEGTVKIHITAIFKTLGVKSRTQAATWAHTNAAAA